MEPKAGNDVYLTIDKDLKITAYKLIEEKLAAVILEKSSKKISAVHLWIIEENGRIVICKGRIDILKPIKTAL